MHAGRVSTAQQLTDGEFATRSLNYVWDPILLDFVVATPGAAGGGIAAAITVVDGGDVAQGATTNLESAAGNGSVIAILKRLRTLLSNPLAVTPSDAYAENTVVATANGAPVLFKDDAFPNTLRIPSSGNPLPVTILSQLQTNIKGGTGGIASVKTNAAAIATDPALVVTLSPNNGVDVLDRAARVLGKAQILDSASALIDPSTKAQLPAALTVAGNLKVSIQEDGGAVIGVDDNAGSLTTDTPQLPAALVGGRVDVNIGAAISLPGTVVDGGDVTQGAKADAAWDGVAAAPTGISIWKYLGQKIEAVRALLAGVLSVAGPALTKGTQGANGFSMQSLKDAGRVQFSCSTVIAGIAGVAAEAVMTMVPVRDGVAAATNTTQAVTAAKRLRLTHIVIGFVSTAAAVVSVRAGLRINPAGAAVVASPLIFPIALPSAAALAQQGGFAVIPLPDGFEFSGAHQFALSHVGSVATYTLWAALVGFEY